MSEQSAGARLFFTDLVDAVRFSQAWAKSIEEQGEYRRRAEAQIAELGELSARIAADFDGLKLEKEYADPLSKVINEFAAAAIQQQREKLNARLKAWSEESTAASEAERLKALRSLESYLASTPLPVLDEEIVLDLSDSSYTVTLECKCPGNIEYKFLLNTANSVLFRGAFHLSDIRRGLKLPVRLGKAWLRKEAVPDFEKLDGYALSTARASRNHLVSNFANPETNSKVAIVFSRSGKDSFVTAEYSDVKGKVDVTGEPALSKHLDLESMKAAMNQLLDSISALKKEKVQLTRLEAQGKDILVTLDCYGFMQQVAAVTVQTSESMEEMRKLDPKMALDRLKLIGPGGSSIMEQLGISVRPTKPKQPPS
jgi:hypothetical protein